MHRSNKTEKTLIQQSDIVIHPDGSVSISFLWNDLLSLRSELNGTQTNNGEVDPVTSPLGANILEAQGSTPLVFPVHEYQNCKMCPRECGFDRSLNTHSTCGDSALRIATAELTFGDEKPISGTWGSGAIMLSGCPLKCFSCHNPEMVSQGKKVTIPEFISVAASLMKSGAHNLQILSPTVHFPALRIALRELRRIGFPLPIIFKSSGYERVEELRTFEGLVDIFLPDLKFGSNSSLAGVAGVADYFKVTTAAIEEMIRQTGPLLLDNEGIGTRGVLIRHVRAPIYKDEWAALSTYLDRLPKGVVVSINKNFVNLTPLPDERGNR